VLDKGKHKEAYGGNYDSEIKIQPMDSEMKNQSSVPVVRQNAG